MAFFPNYTAANNLFQSQEYPMMDSFGNPVNPAYMNQGWGMNSNYLTPSYDAPYRPQYSGSSPYNQYGHMTMGGASNQLFNPFYREPYWGNPVDNNQQAISAFGYRPTDAMAWTGQRVLAPALAFGGAYRMLGARTFGGYFNGGGMAGAMGRNFGMGFGRGINSAFGLGNSFRAAQAAGTVGQLGMGARMGGMISGGLEGTLGGIGSLAGNIFLPMMAAQGALAVGQAGIWDPYMNTRRSMMDLQRNFSGVTFGDATGNTVTGGGLGYREATHMAQEITRQGINDFTFSPTQYRNIADMSARAGLMDNVKSQQITQRIKDVAEQIKMIVAISNDPDIKDAIEELSKLNLSGANLSGGRFSIAASTYRGLGRYASEAGTSIQHLMSTVGAQGQYMYQSMGMTPYMGQMAAGNVYSSFAAAQRVGLMSPAQLARMGGVEGATQSSLGGQIGVANSTYAQMAAYNQYLGGNGGSAGIGAGMTTTGVVSAFGGHMAGNPVGTIGAMGLYGPQMAGKMITENGGLGIQNAVASVVRQLHLPTGPSGKPTAEQAYAILTNMFQTPPDQARAMIAQWASEANPEVAQQRARGVDRNTQEQLRQFISQNMAYGGAFGQTARALEQGKKGITNWMADTFVNPVTDTAAKFSDWFQGGVDNLQFGSTLGKGTWTVNDVTNMYGPHSAPTKTTDTLNLIGSNNSSVGSKLQGMFTGKTTVSSFTSRTAGKINELAKAGDADARAFLSAKSDSEKLSAFNKLAKNNPEMFGEEARRIFDPNNPQAAQDFVNEIKSAGSVAYTASTTTQSSDVLSKSLTNTLLGGALGTATRKDVTIAETGQTISISDTVSGQSEMAKRLKGIGGVDQTAAVGQALNLGNGIAGGDVNAGTIDAELAKPANAQLRAVIGNVSGASAIKAIQGIIQGSARNGTYEIGQIMNDTFVDKAGNHGMQALMNTKGGLISDPKLRKQFQAAMAAGDKDAMNRIAMQAGVGAAGDITGRAIKGDVGSFSNVMGLVDIQMGGDKERRDLLNRYKQGQIDFQSYTQTTSALDMKDAVDTFKDAVDDFVGGVKANNKGGDQSGTGSPSLFSSLFGSNSSKSNVPDDTSRGIGSRGPNSN